MKPLLFSLFVIGFLGTACSPIKSSPQDVSHRMELTLQEVQTNIDDSRHDIHCFRSELDIIDGRLRQLETNLSSFKTAYLTNLENRCDYLAKQIAELENKTSGYESTHKGSSSNLKRLSEHANETSHVLEQFKSRMNEIEKSVSQQNKKLDEVTKLRRVIEKLADDEDSSGDYIYYKVVSGDSLERIAKKYHVTIDEIKKANQLAKDLIVVGQKLKIPKK